jgi:cell division protein FtsW
MDGPLLWSALLLLALGLVMVSSASMPLAAERHGDPLYFFTRQLTYAVVALIVGYACYRFAPLAIWRRLSPLAWPAALVLSLIVLIPGIGREVNGSLRWISFGSISFQASELVKFLAIVYLAGLLHRYQRSVGATAWGGIRPLLPIVPLMALVLVEPDLGAAGVMGVTAATMVFLAGMRLIPLLLTVGAASATLVLALYLAPYRLARLVAFRDPWQDPFGDGFQLVQSLIAIGRGGVVGVGLGDSVQKLFYLPEAHTDFILAVLAEELGLLGVLALLVAYGLLVWRCFVIAGRCAAANNVFASQLCFGVGVWFALQALINLGVNMGLLPTKGLTLPLLSYGGSSLTALCMALGLVLRADAEWRLGQATRRDSMRRAPPPPATSIRTLVEPRRKAA